MKKSLSVIIIGASAILIVAQILNSVLGVSSFESTLKESLISRYQIVEMELKRKIETSVNYGKPIYLFNGMDKIFNNIMTQEKNITNIYVTLPDGKILYSTNKSEVDGNLNVTNIPVFHNNPKEEDLAKKEIIQSGDYYFIALPLYYHNSDYLGMVVIQFEKKLIQERVNAMIFNNVKYLAIIIFCAIIALISLLVLINNIYLKNKFLKKIKLNRLNFISIIIILISAQLTFSFINNKYFEKTLLKVVDEKLETLSNTMKNYFEYFLNLDMPVNRLKNAELYLDSRLKNNPEAAEIITTDNEGKTLYFAKDSGVDSVLNKETSLKENPIYEKIESNLLIRSVGLYKESAPDTVEGYIIVKVNEKVIKDKLFDLVMDAITVIVVSLVAASELLLLLSLVINKINLKSVLIKPEEKSEINENADNMKIIRFIAFLFFFAELIPLSYLPIFVQKLYTVSPVSVLGFSEQAILSLPLSSYMLGVTLFVPFIGFLLTKVSVRKLFLLCSTMLIIGSFFSAFSFHVAQLIIFRFISGLGYGGVIIIGTDLVVKFTKKSNRTAGFGNWSAGFAAASICAIAIGGVIVNRLGYRVGMLTSTLFAVILVIFVIKFVKIKDDKKKLETKKTRVNLKEFLCIFKNPNLIAFLFFSSIPFQIAYIGIFQYVFPLFMNDLSISQANIGRLLTIYGLISLATPMISSFADRIKNDRIIIIVGNLIMALFMILFIFGNSVYIFIISIVAIGIGSMFTDAVGESFIVSTKEAKEIGEAKLLSIFTTYDKIFSIAVPILAGILITNLSFSKSIVVMGVISLVGVAIFTIMSKNTRVD